MQSSGQSSRARIEQGAVRAFAALDAMTDDVRRQLFALARSASRWGRRTADELSQALGRIEARAGRSER
jgi:hypothetical protein